MKLIWNALLHLSAFAAQKLYGERVTQVDIWLESGKKLMLMDRDESEKLARVSRLLQDEWAEQEKEDLRLAIRSIREHEKESANA